MPAFRIAVCAPRLGQSQLILKPVVNSTKTLMAILKQHGEHWSVIDDNSTHFTIECGDTKKYCDQRDITAYSGDPTVSAFQYTIKCGPVGCVAESIFRTPRGG